MLPILRKFYHIMEFPLLFNLSPEKLLECWSWKAEKLKFGSAKLEIMNTTLTLSSIHKYNGKDFEAMRCQLLFSSLVSSSSQIQGKLLKNVAVQWSFASSLWWLTMHRGQNMRDSLNGTRKILVMYFCIISLLLSEWESMR